MLFRPSAAAVDQQITTRVASAKRKAEAARAKDEQAAADAAMRSLELHRLDGTIVPLPAPSPAKIARHVKLYGNEGVEETIRAYPATALPLATYRTKAPSGRRLDSQTISAIRHFAQDSPVSALANTFNLTERRVKEVLASSA